MSGKFENFWCIVSAVLDFFFFFFLKKHPVEYVYLQILNGCELGDEPFTRNICLVVLSMSGKFENFWCIVGAVLYFLPKNVP